MDCAKFVLEDRQIPGFSWDISELCIAGKWLEIKKWRKIGPNLENANCLAKARVAGSNPVSRSNILLEYSLIYSQRPPQDLLSSFFYFRVPWRMLKMTVIR